MSDISARSLALHEELAGKIEVVARAHARTAEDLALLYTPGVAEPWPIVRDTEGGLSVVASAGTLDEASKMAADAMHDYLLRRTAVDGDELILLMSLLCHLEISQVVDPLVTARCRLRDWDVPFVPAER